MKQPNAIIPKNVYKIHTLEHISLNQLNDSSSCMSSSSEIYILAAVCIRMFCVYLGANSDYFSVLY